MIDTTAVSRYADRILAMVREDMERPSLSIHHIPRDVTSFTELHEYCDANDYLTQAGVPWGTDLGAGEDGVELLNMVCSEVTRRLEAGELRR